jgi:pimeloyl-ACP methyl ester carboxylesterase
MMPNRDDTITFEGARRPDRQYIVSTSGIDIAVYEWGVPNSDPLLLAHGGSDFAGTFDVFAPLLAAGGWRVIAWDQRGHGDSGRSDLYGWSADLRDLKAVFDHVGHDPVVAVGHSKGGELLCDFTEAHPARIKKFVNLDGLPSRRPAPDIQDHERTQLRREDITTWLDYRRGLHDYNRRPGTLQEIVERRKKMNPRLSDEWLTYIATIGARQDPEGWRWKVDPAIRFGGFGPSRPYWGLYRMAGFSMPFLGVLGMVPEQMGWGTKPEEVMPWLPRHGRLEVLHETGHFVHIERPHRVAELVLEFLAQ